MLEKVEPSKMSNFGNVKSELVDVYYDSGRAYSVPWQVGTTSFMVDTAVYKGNIDTLAILFDTPDEIKGKVNVLKDVNDVINAALRYLDYPRCNSNPKQLKEVSDLLLKSKKDWLSFNSDGAKEVLVSGDAVAGMIWNGYGLRARSEKSTLKYAYPKEGLTAWMDNAVVLKGSPNLKNAKLFMNFIMIPENAAMISNLAKYASGIKGTDPYLTDDLKGAYELNPPANSTPAEFVPPCDAKVVKIYDRIWTKLLK